MSDNSQNNRRIAKNATMLYIRMAITMFISLYTSRIILKNLGVEDYGTYNLVGGIVAMFSFINSSMSACTIRFITNSIAAGDIEDSKKTFSTSIIVHLIISAILVIFAETIGLWFLLEKMEIPEASINAAFWVYQISIITTVILIISVPYNAIIIAYERMSAFAYISIIETILRLLAAAIIGIFTSNKLIIYAIIIFAIQLSIRIIYNYYCKRKFPETRCKLKFDRELSKKMLSFTGWDLYGNLSTVMRTQGISMLLYRFFGPIANASSAIAAQVQGLILNVSSNIIMAFRPQIIKAYSTGEYHRMTALINRGSYVTFLISAAIMSPIIILIPDILELWLVEVPEYASIFVRTTLFFSLYSILSQYIIIGVHATGKIKRPSLINGTLYILVVPFSYFAYKNGMPPESAYIYNAVAVAIGTLSNAYTLNRYCNNFSFKKYFIKIFLKCIIVNSVLLVSLYPTNFIETIYIKLTAIACITIFLVTTIIFITFSKKEKEYICKIIKIWKRH